MTTGKEFIQNIQNTFIFNSVKALLNGAKVIVAVTPTPWDDLAVQALLTVVEGLEKADSKDEALQALATALPDDDAIIS